MKKANSLLVLLSLSIVSSLSAHTTALPHAHHNGEGLSAWGVIALGLGLGVSALLVRRLLKVRRQKVDNR